MTTRLPLAALAGLMLTLAPGLRAQDAKPADAKAVITKAIEAHGGEAALSKMKAMTGTTKGTMTFAGQDIAFTGQVASMMPDSFKMVINAEVMGQKMEVVQIIKGDKEYRTLNKQKMPAPTEGEKAEAQQALVMQEVMQMVPLLSDKYTLAAEKGEKVGEVDTDAVLITPKKGKPVTLYFDKKSGLLVKSKRKALAPGSTEGKEVVEETLLKDYKKVDGVQISMTAESTHDGAKFMSFTMSDVKISEKLDAKLFTMDD